MASKNGISIKQFFISTVDQLFTSNVVLASLLLGDSDTAPTGIRVAIGQTVKVKYWVKFTVGATGGIRLQLVVPAGGTIFSATIRLNNTVAPSSTIATQQASAVFTNALANAGTHWIEVEAVIVNGATAGTIDLQMAQNTSDALTLTILRGATVDVNKI